MIDWYIRKISVRYTAYSPRKLVKTAKCDIDLEVDVAIETDKFGKKISRIRCLWWKSMQKKNLVKKYRFNKRGWYLTYTSEAVPNF
jgi:hypothetical protein